MGLRPNTIPYYYDYINFFKLICQYGEIYVNNTPTLYRVLSNIATAVNTIFNIPISYYKHASTCALHIPREYVIMQLPMYIIIHGTCSLVSRSVHNFSIAKYEMHMLTLCFLFN